MSIDLGGVAHLSRGSAPDYDSDYTVHMAVRFNTITAFSGLLSIVGNDNTDIDVIKFNGSGQIGLESRVAGVYQISVNSAAGTIVVDTQYMIDLVRDGLDLSLYLDGVLVASGSNTSLARTPAETLVVGAYGDAFSDNADVDVADMRLWTAALSNSPELAAERASPIIVRSADVWGDWDLPDTSTTTDASGFGRNFTLTGSATNDTDPTYDSATVETFILRRRR